MRPTAVMGPSGRQAPANPAVKCCRATSEGAAPEEEKKSPAGGQGEDVLHEVDALVHKTDHRSRAAPLRFSPDVELRDQSTPAGRRKQLGKRTREEAESSSSEEEEDNEQE